MYSFAVAMEHIIEIEERLTKIVKANASTRQDAKSIVEQLYNREEIVLDYSDFSDVAFRVIDSYELVRNGFKPSSSPKPSLYYKSPNHDFSLLQGNCIEVLPQFDFEFDMIFADPPYFLSNGGRSLQNGKIVCVDKGNWDKGGTPESVNAFNHQWLSVCRDKLKPNGTIWISGTYHNIFSVATQLTLLGFKILNVITWAKTNPPPNFSCRYFTYSTEFIIWARKEEKVPHYYNYELMREINGGKQMKDVWHMPAIGRWEKSCGKHPTQKPLSVLSRIILASTRPNAWILDPFAGSSTTGIAANLLGRKYLGIDIEKEFLELSKLRREELEQPYVFKNYSQRIKPEAIRNTNLLNTPPETP